jgi:hypothetical protein
MAIERQRGGHAQLAHPTRPGLVTVPQHPGEILKPKTLSGNLEQAGLTVDDLRTCCKANDCRDRRTTLHDPARSR